MKKMSFILWKKTYGLFANPIATLYGGFRAVLIIIVPIGLSIPFIHHCSTLILPYVLVKLDQFSSSFISSSVPVQMLLRLRDFLLEH